MTLEDAEKLRAIGKLGQDDSGDPSWLFRLADEIEAMADFTPVDVGAVNAAMVDAKHEAKERRDRMPSSAAALDQRAEQLLAARDKILDRLPEEFHEHRKAYPDYYG